MTDNNHAQAHKQPLPSLAIAAIGVVFGDIGTSPLYALKEAFSPAHGIALTNDSILGVISLLFWAIVIVVSIKYVLFVMRADNNGEGGVLALMALALRPFHARSRTAGLLMMLGIFGACMFYGDAVITPAISVMSAVEGLESRRRICRISYCPSRASFSCCCSGFSGTARRSSAGCSGRSWCCGSSRSPCWA
jgi:KUP system potassium uptake protein